MNERLNIRRFQAPESEANLTFDVERDVRTSDWTEMARMLSARYQDVSKKFFEVAPYAWILDPHRSGLDLFNISKYELRAEEWRQSESSEAYLELIRGMRIMGLPAPVDEETIHDLRLALEEARRPDQKQIGDWFYMMEASALNAFTLSPVEIAEPMQAKIQRRLEILREAEPDHFAFYASRIKILDPSFSPTLDDWKRMRKDLAELRPWGNVNILEFTRLAASMKILAAGTAQMTEKGLILSAKEKEVANPELPTTLELP